MSSKKKILKIESWHLNNKQFKSSKDLLNIVPVSSTVNEWSKPESNDYWIPNSLDESVTLLPNTFTISTAPIPYGVITTTVLPSKTVAFDVDWDVEYEGSEEDSHKQLAERPDTVIDFAVM